MVSQAIVSILGQTMGDLELLVLDDSVSPETVAAIDRLAAEDVRVRVIRREGRMGFVHALNVGLEAVKGRFIARMDGDDIAMPRRLELQAAYLDAHPEVDVLGGAMDIVDANGALVSHRDYPAGGFRMRAFSIFRSPLAHPTVMMRRAIVDAGIRYDEDFRMSEDLELWLRLQRGGYRLANMQDTLLRYRVVGDLADKRTGENFRYNFRARRKNFSWRSPLWGLASLAVSKLYAFVPKSVVSMAYRRS
jgi:glycosyltransferase involved in cell wall biosynthesis